jgi:hypothetical protein
MMIKKKINVILKMLFTKKFYNYRHKSLIYLIYYKLEINIKCVALRLKNPKLFFIPTKHLIAAHLYQKISIYLKTINQEHLMFGGTLLGVIRNQNACAGSAKDLDIAIIINSKDRNKFLNKLKSYFYNCPIKINNDFNSIHLNFIKYHYYIDIAFILKKKNKTEYLHYSSAPYPKKITLRKKDIYPLKNKKLYYENCFVPNNSNQLLNLLFKKKWRKPHRKRQLYL